MKLIKNCSLFAFILFAFHFQITHTQTQAVNTSEHEYLPYTIRLLQKYEGQRRCGFRDRNVYMNNGTYEEVGFYSNEKFSLFVEADSTNMTITGFTIASEISNEELQNIKASQRKLFYIERYKKFIFEEQSENNQEIVYIKESVQKFHQVSVMHYANLKVYGICRTASVSIMSKNLQVKITYLKNLELPSFISEKILSISKNQQDPNSFTPSLNNQTVTIPTVVYCIDGVSIKQANFFVCKIFYVLIFSLIALLLGFKPFKKVPFFLRLFCLIVFTYFCYQAITLYEALFITYSAIFILVVFYRIFQEKHSIQSQAMRKQTLVTKTYILVSFASALPLAIKSHLDDESVQQKKIILYPINFILISNCLLFISSMVHLTRFRHAFYYFLGILFAQHYLFDRVKSVLAFGILQFQIFPVPYDCEPLFFALWIVPLCDFFFKSYSSQALYKFVIILVPILARPFSLSFSTTFLAGLAFWIINGRLNGKDIIKIIKYKK